MHQIVKRAAFVTMAVAATGLVATACGDDNKTPSVNDLKSSAGAAAGSIVGSATVTTPVSGQAIPMPGSGTVTTPVPGQAMAGNVGPGGVAETKIPTPSGDVTVADPLLSAYQRLGGMKSPLGLPQSGAQPGPANGKYQVFDGGVIYWSAATGAHAVWGDIRTAWEADGGAAGSLGYPTSDENDVAGGKETTFTGGKISWVNGKTTVTPK